MNYFLDCGFYVGKIIETYFEKGIIDDTWNVISFEPNPEADVEKELERMPVPVKMIREAVWTEDTKIPFWISGGASASHADDTSYHAREKSVMVKSIDFSRFVAELPDPSHIICSMDIEGSEFRVLEKMIKDGTINRISVLDIEFHHRLMPDKTTKDARKLIKEIRSHGIKVKLKVPLI